MSKEFVSYLYTAGYERPNVSVGFTGTRRGMDAFQKIRVKTILDNFKHRFRSCQFHHGDCIGADAEAAQIAKDLIMWTIIGHPPDVDTYRAFFKSDTEDDPLPYLQRDRVIVQECDILIAAPFEYFPKRHSGTWTTIGYAKEARKPIEIAYPNGATVRPDGTVKFPD